MCTTVFHELRKRGARGIVFTTRHPSLFQVNPDLDNVLHYQRPRVNRWMQEGLPFRRLGYAPYDPETDRDEPLTEHVLKRICRVAGLTGAVDLRPYLFLTPPELASGRLGDQQIVMQSSGLGAAHSMRNKEWYPERFQEVCAHLCADHTVVQIGSTRDPKLEGALDRRGQTTLRQSAAILANSLAFIGLVGFPMHLARAVECRGVILYGGRERPWQTGYLANVNLTGEPPCSPCWLRNRCDYQHVCMDVISPETVLSAVKVQIERQGTPLETETADL
jgi:ADP-heptose:LPS heptosyltransferase